MVAYIQQLAQILISRFRDAVGFGQLEEVADYIRALREELDRLDPRDFVADTRVAFIELRFRVRRMDTGQQNTWKNLILSLENARQAQMDLHQRAPNDPLRRDLEGVAEKQSKLLQQLYDTSAFFQKVINILNSYGGEGSHAVVRTFPFVQDPDLRKIVERDYRELKQILFPDGAWKSVVIMAGSILEAILYDLLTRDTTRTAAAMASSKAPKKRGGVVRDLTQDTADDEWKLINLIDVSVDLGLLRRQDADTIHQSLRDYRNFVHPRKEMKSAHPCTEAEAMQALGALDGVCNHLK